MIRIGVLGGRGFVGEELLNLLSVIPEYKVVYVGSRGRAGQKLDRFANGQQLDLHFSDLSRQSIESCIADAWVIAQDNGQSAPFVEILERLDTKMIDVSSDYRFDDAWTYGLPERNAANLRSARRIANPGCYATAVQLSLIPLLDQIENTPVSFGVSGFSGAGRKPGDRNDPERLADNLLPYALSGHTHEQEISHQLQLPVRFMPHVAPFFRGISVTTHVVLRNPTTDSALSDQFEEYYSDQPLVEVTTSIPEIQQVAGTNLARVGGFTVDARDQSRIAVVSVLDNLRKGAASQVIQNLNLAFGLPMEHGLLDNQLAAHNRTP
jgi:N-acetyl-gamma-glutamyl-phosphate reductase